MELLMNSNVNSPVNIGNPEEFPIIDLANKITKIINPKLKLTYKPLPEDDPLMRRPDISKARKNLMWEPKINLEKGLNLTIDWFKENYFS